MLPPVIGELSPPAPAVPRSALVWLGHAWSMLYVVVVLWAFSTPAGPGFVSTAFVVLSPVVLLAAWLVWLAFWASTRRLAQTWRHLLVVPVAGIVVAVLLLLAAPLQIRVALSRGSMDALARQVLAGRPGSLDDRKVGLYHATGIERIRGGMSFRVQETSALTPGGGFAFHPGGPPAPPPAGYVAVSYGHLVGPWYAWTDRFTGSG